MRRHYLAAAAAVWLAFPAAAQPVPDFDEVKASEQITDLLARHDVDGAAQLKDVFQLVRGLGRSQYTDLVYAHDYGKTEKDVIYKIDFDKAFLFVRYLYHVDNGAWRLIHIHLKTENDVPFPKEWTHIYPN